MTKIAGGKVSSLSALKASLEKQGGGNGTWIKYVPKNDVLVVRFLAEPDEWREYLELWTGTFSRPLLEGEDVGPDARVSTRYLACVVDIGTDRVIPLMMPKDLASRVYARFEKYGTLTDRDYELSRRGSGLDTTYDVATEAPAKRALTKYTALDLDEVLLSAAQREDDPVQKFIDKGTTEDEPELDDDPELDLELDADGLNDAGELSLDDVDDDGDEFPDEDDEITFTKADLSPKPVGELRLLAKAKGINTAGLNKAGLIAALTA